MSELKAVNLEEVTQSIRGAIKPVSVLWQTPDSIAFVARGREYRSEFHVDPSDEIMYMIKGDVDLHYINAEGEQQAAQKLLEAAEILGQRPEAMQLRYLNTLNVIAGEKNSTIVFPFPMELSEFFKAAAEKSK